jgi:hypothetical protein
VIIIGRFWVIPEAKPSPWRAAACKRTFADPVQNPKGDWQRGAQLNRVSTWLLQRSMVHRLGRTHPNLKDGRVAGALAVRGLMQVEHIELAEMRAAVIGSWPVVVASEIFHQFHKCGALVCAAVRSSAVTSSNLLSGFLQNSQWKPTANRIISPVRG